jgi:aryl-alcohol dehydrogenase-like predicted oxidoreductase
VEKTRLNTGQLGSTGLEITTVGFGAWAIGHDATPGAVAVAWTLRNPAVDAAIVGFRRPDQVDAIVRAANLELTDDDLDEIEGRSRS